MSATTNPAVTAASAPPAVTSPAAVASSTPATATATATAKAMGQTTPAVATQTTTSPATTSATTTVTTASVAPAANGATSGHTCHARKVRCDAASLGVPCTNCVAFQVECRIPAPKRKKPANSAQNRESDSEDETPSISAISMPPPQTQSTLVSRPLHPREIKPVHTAQGTPSGPSATYETLKHELAQDSYLAMSKPKFSRAPITEAGRVAFLGESSNLNLLVHEKGFAADAVHYPLPESVRGSRMRPDEIDNLEMDILHQRGAFLLPPRALCDEIVEAYFTYVHPMMPMINKTRFMSQYRDQKNPPSLLLLQSVLLAGSRVCTNRQLLDAHGSATPAALTFYKRAKALYDANYEDDRVTIVQSLVLMGWYWEGPEDVTKNVFFWTNMAVTVAQGSGMHRNVENSQLSKADKRLWKRVWWVLFARDRSVAVALGRPVRINLDDSDVPMLSPDDFIETEDNSPNDQAADPTPVNFFLQYVKLCEIMGLVLSQQYSAASKVRSKRAIDLTHSDMALADWLQNCPIKYDPNNHSFWPALLHINYYTILCLLHRAHIPPPGAQRPIGEYEYPSRNIATQAACMITMIVQNMVARKELRFVPGFAVYSIFSALIMHVYQLQSSNPVVKQESQERVKICMTALENVSSVWMVAKLIHKLFSSIIGNKVLEERLQRVGIKRHRKSHGQQDSHAARPSTTQMMQNAPPMPTHAPAGMAQPQPIGTTVPGSTHRTPRPSIDAQQMNVQPPCSAPSISQPISAPPPPHAPPTSAVPHHANTDAFMGGTASAAQSRTHTPFNPAFSVPATPPDLYLFTRNSPNLSQSLWENFQPGQLFPEGVNAQAYSGLSPHGADSLDPATLQATPLSAAGQQGVDAFQQVGGAPPPATTLPPSSGAHMFPSASAGAGFMRQPGMQGNGAGAGAGLAGPAFTSPTQGQAKWAAGQGQAQGQSQGPLEAGQSPDSWSSSSAQGSGSQGALPSTLNVEEWIQFFGFTPDSGFNFDMPMGG
ncbi:hypothetical protein TD95_001409 [Thielaviopsis punctulata]|uniref:Zn(2)-C6 fungal-type domain-containing protein n=1 Tax=Thielaviopsis punctulata TaxID=72032 RepID=A0A0F4Z7T4_9PEZI|nr:hypothetical protein TD95_001409 [Thielaviopsis punctulata]